MESKNKLTEIITRDKHLILTWKANKASKDVKGSNADEIAQEKVQSATDLDMDVNKYLQVYTCINERLDYWRGLNEVFFGMVTPSINVSESVEADAAVHKMIISEGQGLRQGLGHEHGHDHDHDHDQGQGPAPAAPAHSTSTLTSTSTSTSPQPLLLLPSPRNNNNGVVVSDEKTQPWSVRNKQKYAKLIADSSNLNIRGQNNVGLGAGTSGISGVNPDIYKKRVGGGASYRRRRRRRQRSTKKRSYRRTTRRRRKHVRDQFRHRY